MRYDKACSSLRAAKEMIAITEKKLQGDSGAFDATWQEMLNHADVRVRKYCFMLKTGVHYVFYNERGG